MFSGLYFLNPHVGADVRTVTKQKPDKRKLPKQKPEGAGETAEDAAVAISTRRNGIAKYLHRQGKPEYASSRKEEIVAPSPGRGGGSKWPGRGGGV